MGDVQWSKDFNSREFAVSASHKELVEPIPAKYTHAMKKLAVDVLQVVRTELNHPMVVISGYRGEALNRAVGGSSTSQHRVGEAADVTTDDVEEMVLTVIRLVRQGKLDAAGQIIYYPEKKFIHFALRSRRFQKPTLCINWPSEGVHYLPLLEVSVDAFREVVPEMKKAD